MSDTIAIPSTGQTYADLLGFDKLYNLYMAGEGNNTYTQDIFQLPALTNVNYRLKTHDTINLSFASISIIITTLSVVCRLLVRFTGLNNTQYNGRRLLSEDWFLVTAYVSAMAISIILMFETIHHQLGWHVLDMHMSSVQAGLRVIYAIQLLFTFSTTCVRMSSLVFIRRIYAATSDKMNLSCNILLAVNVVYAVAALLAIALECNPVTAAFDIFQFVEASCHQRVTLWTVMIIHVLLDWSVVVLPLGLVWELQVMSTRKRVEAALMFGCGLLACSISTARFQFIDELIPRLMSGLLNNPGRYAVLFVEAELCIAILALCLPSVRQLVCHIFYPSSQLSRTMAAPSKITDAYDIERNLISGSSTPLPDDITEKKRVIVRDVEFEILDKASTRDFSIDGADKDSQKPSFTRKKPEDLQFYNLGSNYLRPRHDGDHEPDSDMDASTESLPLPCSLSPRPRSSSQLDRAFRTELENDKSGAQSPAATI